MPKNRGGRYPYRKRKQANLWWIGGIALGATVLLIVLSRWSAGKIQMPAEIRADQERFAARNVAGMPEAAVELVEYSDYLCPACAKAHQALESQLETLVAAGKLKFAHKHLLVIDKVRSQIAAEAVECAADQGHYWAFHDLLFANQSSGQNWSRSTMKSYAKKLGLDSQAFGQCIDSKKYEEKVLADSKEGAAVPDITGTPSFIVNGKLLQLKQSFNEVIEAINAAAK